MSFYLEMAEKIAKEKHGGHLSILRFGSGWKAIFGTPNLDCGDGRFEFYVMEAYPTIEGALLNLLCHNYIAGDGRAQKEKEAMLNWCRLETEKFNSQHRDLSDLIDQSLACSFSENHSGIIHVNVEGDTKIFTAVWGGPIAGCYDLQGNPILDGTDKKEGYVLRAIWENAK